jgi:hypothetical protein
MFCGQAVFRNTSRGTTVTGESAVFSRSVPATVAVVLKEISAEIIYT